jgi:hypothetical protein
MTRYESGSVIVPENYNKQKRIHYRLRKKNEEILRNLRERRERWQILPPGNMLIQMLQGTADLSGLVLSVPHELGRIILHKRLGRIIERDNVATDAVVEYTDLSEAFAALKLATVGEQG